MASLEAAAVDVEEEEDERPEERLVIRAPRPVEEDLRSDDFRSATAAPAAAPAVAPAAAAAAAAVRGLVEVDDDDARDGETLVTLDLDRFSVQPAERVFLRLEVSADLEGGRKCGGGAARRGRWQRRQA